MARPKKTGLDYFPFDVDFFDDEKMVCIAGEFGLKGEITAVKLLCAVYRNGYFILWSDSLKMKILRSLPGISVDLFDQILNRLVRWGFFDKGLFDSVRVLTSRGIQKRFFGAVKRRKSDDDYPYLLIDINNNPVDVGNNEVNVCNNGVNVCNNSVNVDNNEANLDNNNGTKDSIKDEQKQPERVNVCNNGVNVCNNSINVDNNPQSKVKESKENNKRNKHTQTNTRAESEKSLEEKCVGVFNFFNEMAEYYKSVIRPVKVLTDERRRKIEAVIGRFSSKQIALAISNAMQSDYLNGRTKRRNRPADFDWIFDEANFVRIFEGNV